MRKPFSVRVMIPCYKEDIETLEETVECAIEAAKAAMTKGQTNAGMVTSCDSSNNACGWGLNLLQSINIVKKGSGSGAGCMLK